MNKPNISYSALETYLKSQLQFFFQYVVKVKETNPTTRVYGDAGSVVHEAIEEYIKSEADIFDEKWDGYNIDNQKGFNGVKLNQQKYRDMFEKAKKIVDAYKIAGYELETEKKFEFKFQMFNMKGFIDVVATKGDEVVLIDWKTNSTANRVTHSLQRTFYSWAYNYRYGGLPRCEWHYLNIDQVYTDELTQEALFNFQEELTGIIDGINKKGRIVSLYEEGNWNNPFNAHKVLCEAEIMKRNGVSDIVIKITGSRGYVSGVNDANLWNALDWKTKFDLPEKYYMQQAVARKGKGNINLEEVGTVHLFKVRNKSFPIGLLETVKKICNDYIEYYGTQGKVVVEDVRMKTPNVTYPLKASVGHIRDYQHDAVDAFLDKEMGIINIATGGGKTYVGARLIRIVCKKTLWVCDRVELLEQTKAELENHIGVEVGVIQGSTVDTTKDITVATVQSLVNKRIEIQRFMKDIGFLVIDEYHKAAAESFQIICDEVPNTEYRLGLTATAMRDDGRTPILHGLLGDVIYKKTSQDLIAEGYLTKPEIIFKKVYDEGEFGESYATDYQVSIVENDARNNLIIKLAEDNGDKKVMILTRQVGHGKLIADALDIPHIHGKLNPETRSDFMSQFKSADSGALVMTISIGAEGLDIPDLDVIINAAGNRGDVKSIQILGRVLRRANGKDSATYYDFMDSGEYTEEHSRTRVLAFQKEGHEVRIE